MGHVEVELGCGHEACRIAQDVFLVEIHCNMKDHQCSIRLLQRFAMFSDMKVGSWRIHLSLMMSASREDTQ